MPPRRSHKKSRAGCRRCKSRKIKCDEIHPRCGNCVKHGVVCDFEHPEIAESLMVPDTPALSAASPSFCGSPAAAKTSRSPMTAGNSPLTLYRPDPPAILQGSRGNRMMELRLLHHYTTVTHKTLAVGEPSTEVLWRDTVPRLAFGGATFLADALLAVTALHMRSHSPNDQELVRASHAYMASTLSEYSSNLGRGINESNAEALFLASTLIAFTSAASRVFVRDDGGDLKDYNEGYALPISWFHSFQGVKTVVASSWQWLRNSGIVISIVNSQPALNLDLNADVPTFFGNLLDGLEEELNTLDSDSRTQWITRQAYQHAVAVLNWAHKMPHIGAPMVFPATVSRRYIELLQNRRPRALAILANWFGLLKSLDSICWWVKGISRREVMGIVSLFDPDDEEWWPRLQWPIRMALYDGDDIPPEIWGTVRQPQDRSNAAEHSDTFMSHIETLTQMFNALQNMRQTAASASSDSIACSAAIQASYCGAPIMLASEDALLLSNLIVPTVD